MNLPRTERKFYSLLTNLWEGQVSILQGLTAKLLQYLQEERRKRQEGENEVQRLYSRILDLETEQQRDKGLVPLDDFCPHCNRPWKYWDGKRYRCWQCGEF